MRSEYKQLCRIHHITERREIARQRQKDSCTERLYDKTLALLTESKFTAFLLLFRRLALILLFFGYLNFSRNKKQSSVTNITKQRML